MFFNLFCGSEKAEATLGTLFVVKAGSVSHSGYFCVPGIGPVPRSLAHLAEGVCSVFWFSFCKDIARKVNNKGKVLRELECGCYGDILCCE